MEYEGDDNFQTFRNTTDACDDEICVNPISQSAVRAEQLRRRPPDTVRASEKVKAAFLAVRRLKFKITALTHLALPQNMTASGRHDQFIMHFHTRTTVLCS